MKINYTTEDSKLALHSEGQNIFWIEMVNPTEEEINEVLQKYKMPKDYIYSVLDAQEVPRTEGLKKDKPSLFLLSYPVKLSVNKYTTKPISIIMVDGVLITVTSQESEIVNEIKNNYLQLQKEISLANLLTEIAWKICSEYVKYVKEINGQIDIIENLVRTSTNSKVFSDMIDIQKSLITFNMATRENGPVVNAIFEEDEISKNTKSEELLHDLQVENKQAMIMIEESTTIMENLSDLYSNLISYNLNVVMKVLTSITIVMTVPTIIGGLWGMNVRLPIEKNPMAFWLLVLLSVVISWIIVKFLKKKGYL